MNTIYWLTSYIITQLIHWLNIEKTDRETINKTYQLTGCIITQLIHWLNNEQRDRKSKNLLANWVHYYTIDSLAQ